MAAHAQKISDAKYTIGAEYERTSKQYTRALVPSDIPLYILDIGCGTGINAKALAANGHTVVGIDISPVAIDKFRREGFEGKQCDITEGIPYPDETFELVFASEVIEHVVDTEAFLAEICRVLRPSGRLVLSTPNSAFWVYRLFALLGRTVSDVQHRGHVRFFSRFGLARQVSGAGFEAVAVSGRHMYLILGERIGRSLEGLLRPLGFEQEIRFRTQAYFWHLSHFAKRASPLWTDTLILTARKPAS